MEIRKALLELDLLTALATKERHCELRIGMVTALLMLNYKPLNNNTFAKKRV
jgi:hypothetical protein